MFSQDHLDSITAKEAEISNYTRILAAYAARGGGRWYDQGRRHLESLRSELHALKILPGDGPAPPAPLDEHPLTVFEKTDNATSKS
jgi:hypothetical protein